MDILIIKNSLKQLLNLLEKHQVRYAVIIKKLIIQLEQMHEEKIPESLIKEIKELFGGMGSLNDIYICSANGHLVNNEKEANQRLNELKSALWNEVKG